MVIYLSTIELFLIGIALSMDAFSVSICKGLTMIKFNIKQALFISFMFGLFQGIMPLIGYILGYTFTDFISFFDHWIAFFLLSFIGLKMIKDSFNKNENEQTLFNFKEIFLLAIATSMDALTVGITFAFLKINIFYSISIIMLNTFVICLIGVIIGKFLGGKYSTKSLIFGGTILILLGLKILLDHLFL